MDKMKETIIWVLTLLSTLFGRVPKIGPVLNLLLLLVTQYWPEVVSIMKKLPAKATGAVTRDAGTKVRARSLLLRKCRQVASEEE